MRSTITKAGVAAWLICLATAFWAVRGEAPGNMAKALALAAIPLALPFLVLAVAARATRSRQGFLLLLTGVAVALAWWLYAFLSTFVFPDRLDAQSGLVFIIGPIYGVIGAVIIAIIALVVDRLARR
jgi:predicted permease